MKSQDLEKYINLAQFSEIKESLSAWRDERALTIESQLKIADKLLMEEYGELAESEMQNDINGALDALCDIVVVMINSGLAACQGVSIVDIFEAIQKMGYSPYLCMQEVLKELQSRKGAINAKTGKWEKFTDIETYKADFKNAKIADIGFIEVENFTKGLRYGRF